MNTITPQFRNTACRLIRDLTAGLGRKLTDANWIGGFCLPAIGSFGHECGGFLKMEEGKPTVMGSLGGISFAQWTGMRATAPQGRRYQFMAFCRERNLHPYGYEAAVGFILHELTTTAKGVVNSTLNAPEIHDAAAYGFNAPGIDPALLGRVVKFEKLYENAGVKHYPSRYAFAIMAKQVFTEWATAGFPEPGLFVMPKSRFSQQFDAEFGRGETGATTRWDTVLKVMPLPDGRSAVSHAGGDVAVIEHDSDPAAALAPPVALADPRLRAGTWPEDRLSKPEIQAIQLRLRQLGYVRVGEADGKWGTATRGAIAALQTEAGIVPDTHYGPATRKALMQGVEHHVPEARASVTSKELLAAGEPTMQAVHPVSVTSKLTTWGAGAAALISGITSAWPQASTTIDQVKAYFGDVPGWAWFVAVAAVAAYLWVSTRQVKQSVVAGYRQGAVTTIATPIQQDVELRAGFMPAVPDEPAQAPMFPGEKMSFDRRAPGQFFARDHESPTSEPERPLGVE